MRGSHWISGFLLVWGMFQSIEADKGECPSRPVIDFAETFADQYVVGTTLVYKCETGYKRKSGTSSRVKCQNHAGYAQWQTEPDMCIVDPLQPLPEPPSEQSETALFGEKWEGTSSGLQATAQPVMKDFCGIPRSPKHATVKEEKYYVGQKLNYVCWDGYRARPPISEVSTCENLRGKMVWSSLTLSCTNDSSVAEEAATKLLATGLAPVMRPTTSTGGWFHFLVVAAIATIAMVIIL